MRDGPEALQEGGLRAFGGVGIGEPAAVRDDAGTAVPTLGTKRPEASRRIVGIITAADARSFKTETGHGLRPSARLRGVGALAICVHRRNHIVIRHQIAQAAVHISRIRRARNGRVRSARIRRPLHVVTGRILSPYPSKINSQARVHGRRQRRWHWRIKLLHRDHHAPVQFRERRVVHVGDVHEHFKLRRIQHGVRRQLVVVQQCVICHGNQTVVVHGKCRTRVARRDRIRQRAAVGINRHHRAYHRVVRRVIPHAQPGRHQRPSHTARDRIIPQARVT